MVLLPRVIGLGCQIYLTKVYFLGFMMCFFYSSALYHPSPLHGPCDMSCLVPHADRMLTGAPMIIRK